MLQAKLLRAIEAREILPIGASSPIQVDIRIISATNQNLAQFIAEGKFREDLFYRLNVIPITLPPLRERQEDIELLVHYFYICIPVVWDRFIRALLPMSSKYCVSIVGPETCAS